MNQEVTEDPVFGQRLGFQRTTGEGGEEVLRIDVWVDPGGGVPAHVHPSVEEHFEVQSGRPDFLAGRTWRTYEPGQAILVPPGLRHAYRNRGDEVAHFVAHARPPDLLQEFLEDVAALSRAGKLMRGGLPRSPSALLPAAILAHHYREMVTFGFPPLPPAPIQRLLLPPLARLGERRGYRAEHFAEDIVA